MKKLSRQKRQQIDYVYGAIVCASHGIDRLVDDQKIEAFETTHTDQLSVAEQHLTEALKALNIVLKDCDR